MFLTAGYLTGEVAGTSWEDVVRYANPGAARDEEQQLCGQRVAEGSAISRRRTRSRTRSLSTFRFRVIDTVGPAGSINSTANDMARWLQLHLGGGIIDGKRIVAARQIQEMHRPQMVIQSFPGLLRTRRFSSRRTDWVGSSNRIAARNACITAARSTVSWAWCRSCRLKASASSC